jgi:hypothetical protein
MDLPAFSPAKTQIIVFAKNGHMSRQNTSVNKGAF